MQLYDLLTDMTNASLLNLGNPPQTPPMPHHYWDAHVMYFSERVSLYGTCKRLLNANVSANNKTQTVLSHDNNTIVSNGHQPPVTSARQPSVKFIHLIIT